VSSAATLGFDVGGAVEHAVVEKKPPTGATTEELVAFLVERDLETQKELQALAKQQEQFSQQLTQQIEGARQELGETLQELERRLADARIHLRLLGLGYVILGIGLSWAGNLV
jgi:hypothetical protein